VTCLRPRFRAVFIWLALQWLRQQNQAAILRARHKHAKTCSNDAGYDLITVPKVRGMLC
jgi:hypothetical protein